MFRMKSGLCGTSRASSASGLKCGTPGASVFGSGGCAVLLALLQDRDGQFLAARAGAGRSPASPLLKTDMNVDLPSSASRRPCALAVDEVGVLEEGEQPLEVGLLVVVDEQVVVALGAAEVDAEEEPADVARQAG